MLQKAIEESVRLHVGQNREGEFPIPYCCHPIEVVTLLRYVGGITDEEMLSAAALHDTVEMCDTTLDKIESDFGSRVCALVQGMTRNEPTQEQTQGLDKEQIRQLRSDKLIEEINEMSPEVQTIKLADRLSNVVEAKRTKKGKKLDRYLKQTKEILKVIDRKVNPNLWDALKKAV